MSDKKMSNLSSTGFELTIEGAGHLEHQVSYVNQDGIDCTNEIHSGYRFAEYAVHAMNLHDKLIEQNKVLGEDISTLIKAIGSAVVAIENYSDMDKESSLLTRALADVETFR